MRKLSPTQTLIAGKVIDMNSDKAQYLHLSIDQIQELALQQQRGTLFSGGAGGGEVEENKIGGEDHHEHEHHEAAAGGHRRLAYGMSVTEPCMDWASTEKSLEALAAAVRERRAEARAAKKARR